MVAPGLGLGSLLYNQGRCLNLRVRVRKFFIVSVLVVCCGAGSGLEFGVYIPDKAACHMIVERGLGCLKQRCQRREGQVIRNSNCTVRIQ